MACVDAVHKRGQGNLKTGARNNFAYSKIMSNRLIASCFRSWVDRLNEKRRDARLLRRCVMRLQYMHVSKLFASWVDLVAEQKRLRVLVSRVLGALSRQKTGRAWRKWVSVMDMLERQRMKAHRTMEAMVNG